MSRHEHGSGSLLRSGPQKGLGGFLYPDRNGSFRAPKVRPIPAYGNAIGMISVTSRPRRGRRTQLSLACFVWFASFVGWFFVSVLLWPGSLVWFHSYCDDAAPRGGPSPLRPRPTLYARDPCGATKLARTNHRAQTMSRHEHGSGSLLRSGPPAGLGDDFFSSGKTHRFARAWRHR